MLAPARPQIAAYAVARSPSRAQTWAAVAAALMCGWTVYADPVARERALELLRPCLAAVLPPPPKVSFGPVSARRGDVGGQTVLYVEGSLRNDSRHALKAPTLLVSLIGDDGRPLYSWKAKPAALELPASGEIAFRTRLASPPPSFRNIAVTLADER